MTRKRSKWTPLVVPIAVLITLAMGPNALLAAPTPPELLERAEEHFLRQEFQKCVDLLELQVMANPSISGLNALAGCMSGLRDYDRVLELLDAALDPHLAKNSSSSEAERLPGIVQTREGLETALNLGRVRVAGDPSGAHVAFVGNDQTVIVPTRGEHRLLAGTYEMRVTSPRMQDYVEVVEVKAAALTPITFTLVPEPPAEPEPPPIEAAMLVDTESELPNSESAPSVVESEALLGSGAGEESVGEVADHDEPVDWKQVTGWTSIGLAAACVGAATGMVIWGEQDHQKVIDTQGYGTDQVFGRSYDDTRGLIEGGDQKKLAGYILFGASAAFAGYGIWALVTDSDDSPASEQAGVGWSWGVSPFGASIHASF